MRGIVVLALGALMAAGMADAGPWVQAPGHWYAQGIITQEDLNGADGNRMELYGEYGFARNWHVTVKSEAVSYKSGSAFDRESLRLTMRRQLVSSKGWTAGVEAGAVYGSAVANIFSCEGFGAEGRLSGGYSGLKHGRNFYAFADAAYISHEDGCERQRAELGYGVDLTEKIFLSQEVWIERGNRTADSDKYQTQLGYHFPWADLALGYREEFSGSFEEESVLVAITVRR